MGKGTERKAGRESPSPLSSGDGKKGDERTLCKP